MGRALRIACLALWLSACTTTYGPGNPPPVETVPGKAVCGEDDAGAGCGSDNPVCQDPDDYGCLGPDS